jgi:hypothetical protein
LTTSAAFAMMRPLSIVRRAQRRELRKAPATRRYRRHFGVSTGVRSMLASNSDDAASCILEQLNEREPADRIGPLR